MTYSVTEIARIIHASCTEIIDGPISLLLTDSRSLSFPEETLFFALKTKQNDGHKYVTELYQKGVRNFVISQQSVLFESLTDANFLLVNDALTALQQLATHHRQKFHIPVIGITGSNGKTIVKEWLYQLLNEDKRIVRSPRSYNSQTGVPLSVWRLEEQAELAIFEAGISQPEEMERLEKIIIPQIGILTNIGSAHQESFQSIEQKCLEKLKLFAHSETIIYEEDDPIVQHCILNTIVGENFLSWSKKNQDAPLFISKVKKEEQSTYINYNYLHIIDGDFEIPFTEDANIENAIHCPGCDALFSGFT